MYLDIKYDTQAEQVYIDKRYICLKLKNNANTANLHYNYPKIDA